MYGRLDNDDLAADGFLKLLRHLRAVLLQDLAVLQPRYPSLPFFGHAPFYGPDWDAFARAVRADATTSEPQSLLLQRALPELSSVLESTREAVLHNSTRLAGQLRGELGDLRSQLAGVEGRLDALFRGDIPITSYFGVPRGPVLVGTTLPPPPPPTSVNIGALIAAPVVPLAPAAPPEPGAPVYTALAKAYIVTDMWREWKEGLGSQPAIQELEETWGSSWRPGNAIRVQFCRRKVIWDTIRARVARGGTEEEAIAELELLRAGRSLSQLVDKLKQRRQHP